MKSLTKKMRLLSVGVAAGLTLGLVGTAAAVTTSSSTVKSSSVRTVHSMFNPPACTEDPALPEGHLRGGSWREGRNWPERLEGKLVRGAQRHNGSTGCDGSHRSCRSCRPCGCCRRCRPELHSVARGQGDDRGGFEQYRGLDHRIHG